MKLSDEIIEKGFWNTDKFDYSKITSVTDLSDYKKTKILLLFITQLTDRSSYKQTKLVNEWCDFLPTLTDIEYLILPSRVNQKIFDSICEIESLNGLWIKWSGIKNIEKLEKLKKLKHLHIGSSSQIENIDVIGKMKGLITLDLEQLNKISNFSVISKLVDLQGLGVDGSIWTTQIIDNLKFIESLKDLRYFTMTNSRLRDKSFDPILKLKKLVRFQCSWNYPEAEFEKLKKLKNLKLGNIETSWKELKAKLDKELKENK